VCSVVSLPGRVHAQAPAQNGLPSVTIMHAGVNQLDKDLAYLLKLAGPAAALQLPVIRGIIPAFTDGVDLKRAITVDIILGNPRDYRVSLPIANLNDLLKNIAGFAGAKGVPVGRNKWVFRGGRAFAGVAIVVGDYLVLANNAANIPRGFSPLVAINRLKKYHMAASVTNTAAGAKDRKGVIDAIRDELEEATTRLPNETNDQFELRKLAQNHRIDELERLFVDAEELVLGWTTNYEKKEGRLDLELSALPGTQLAADIAGLGNDPSLFSSIVRAKNSTVFGRLNHALDQMRQGNITQFLGLIEKQVLKRIANAKNVEDANKPSAADALQKFIGMLQDGNSKVGRIDGFLEITEGKDGRTLVGGIRAHCGTKVEDVLKALQAAGWDVKLNTDESGDAPTTVGDPPPPGEAAADENIEEEATEDDEDAPKQPCPPVEKIRFHEVKIPANREFDFPAVFGTDTMLIAAGNEVVYYAVGNGAEAGIRKAIEATGEDLEKEDGTFFEVWYRIAPWIKWGQERAARLGPDPDLTEKEKQAEAERVALGKRALAVFGGGLDSIYTKLQVKKDDDRKIVVGFSTFADGLLRFVGSEVAKAAKDKLQ
jgi:hypothetical protein